MESRTRLPRLLVFVLLLLLAGCAPGAPEVQRTPSQAFVDTGETRLGHMVAPLAARHPGQAAPIHC